MQPPEPAFTETEHSSEGSERDGQSWRKTAAHSMTILKGWQAIPFAVIAVYILLGILGPTLAPFDPNRGTIATRLCPPLAIDALITAQYPASGTSDCTGDHVLGTDQHGRDIFSQLLHGARPSFRTVGFSVVFGTIAGVILGVWVNGMRPKPRLIGYIVVGAIAVPFAVLVLAQPFMLTFFDVIVGYGTDDDTRKWSPAIALTAVAFVITFALIAVAYRFDDRCVPRWKNGENSDGHADVFCARFGHQVAALRPWIGLSVVGSAALIAPNADSFTLMTSETTWTLEFDYLTEHLGMLSPMVPMIAVPIAFVTLGAWWVKRFILSRFEADAPNLTDTDPLDGEPQEPATDENENPVVDATGVSSRRWIPAVVAIVAVIVIVRFLAADLLPTIGVLTLGTDFGDHAQRAQSVHGRIQTLDCANETSSVLTTHMRASTEEVPQVDPGQRCLALYYENRNAPTHRSTIDYASRFVPRVLTIALIAGLVASVLTTASWTVRPVVNLAVKATIALMALAGLAIILSYHGWLTLFARWFRLDILLTNANAVANRDALDIATDFALALGISYMVAYFAKSRIHAEQTATLLEYMRSRAVFLVPCLCLTSALIIVFRYPFPSDMLVIDNALGVIAGGTVWDVFPSPGSLFRHWLWTYWFALVGYAAIVIALFYAGIWGLARLGDRQANRNADRATLNPDSPSQDADPI